MSTYTTNFDSDDLNGNNSKFSSIAFNVSHLILAFFYFLLLCYGTYDVIMKIRAFKKKKRKKHKYRPFIVILLFGGSIFLGSLFRIIYFSGQAINYSREFKNTYHFYIFTLIDFPTAFYLSTYTILLLFWIRIYYLEKRNFNDRDLFVLICWIINVIIYGLFLFCLLVDFFIYNKSYGDEKSESYFGTQSVSWPEQLVTSFIGFCYFLFSICFLFFGVPLYRGVQGLSMLPQQKRVERSFRIIAIFIPICFLLRTPVLIISLYTPLSNDFWWFDILYYSLLEVLPMGLVILCLQSERKHKDKIMSTINNTPTVTVRTVKTKNKQKEAWSKLYLQRSEANLDSLKGEYNGYDSI
eukprot:TRINITY_DN1093_c0_g3_i2.p1 TRINITY_DN1093_c0_g3~~TRINITY_DN1093_c0_g3_i2.p1  ORF type:complete len:353 (-),score=17.43 TRINITY_DN1093_c0_g3_i2:2-1060(-)